MFKETYYKSKIIIIIFYSLINYNYIFSQSESDLQNSAFENINSKNYEGAIGKFSKAIQLYPNKYSNYMYRGICYYNIKILTNQV